MSEITIPAPDDLLLTNLTLVAPAQVNRSQWTGRRKVIGGPGREYWRGTMALSGIATEEEERQWRAFLFALDGPVNSFRWPLPCNQHIGPKPTVDSGASNGYTLPLTGMQPGTILMRAGQYMTVPLPSGHARAVVLTADLVTDASGKATAQFRPALGEIPTLGATVETATPFIPMSLTTSEVGIDLADGISGTSFEVEEAR